MVQLKEFISEALSNPYNHISYFISRNLAEMCPDRAIVEGSEYMFDIDAYVRAGLCQVVSELTVHSQTGTEWKGRGKGSLDEMENGWLNVLWQGYLLDVVLITWEDGGCKSRQHWILAETKEIAENFFLTVCDWNSEVRSEILVYSGGLWFKNEELYQSIRSATFDNLILAGEFRRELESDFARFFESREVYERYGLPWKRGALMIGPPGNGKTHTIKALINQLKRPCLYARSFKSKYDTEQEGVREFFARARRTAPCMVVLEDLDSLVSAESRAYFLNEMDGFASNTGILVIGTTNHPEKLDPAIRDRPSRFDRKYLFGPPALAERMAYLSRWNDSLQAEMKLTEMGLTETARMTEGFSFAYLKELYVSSMMEWMAAMKPGEMDALVSERAKMLCKQISEGVEAQPDEVFIDEDTDDDD